MSIFDVFVFLGGVGLFLYGISIMGQGLKMLAGTRLKSIFDKVTSNKYVAVLLGTAVTAVIQSSSAITVMVVGFVNAGLMNLTQATGMIMGANIGTTVTSVLIAMDLSSVAPLFIFIGAGILVFAKRENILHIGEIISGFGLLFLGMNSMSNSMEPLKDSQVFVELMTKINNPFAGILIGIALTGVIQSSSAGVGILQALSMEGLVPLEFAVFVIFGQNIGTVGTAMLSSIGANIIAKRAAIIHLLLNVIGTVIFIPIALCTPYIEWLKIISNNPPAQISASHIIFNLVSTIVMLPFINQMVKLSCLLIPDKKKKTKLIKN